MWQINKMPPIVYKYRRESDLTLSLLNGHVFFSPHKLLNDPTDLNPFGALKAELQQRMLALERQIDGSPWGINDEIDATEDEIDKIICKWERAKKRIHHVVSQCRDMGVFCLTPGRDNYSMWTHYSDGFRGVCVGFNRNELCKALNKSQIQLVGPFNVKYQPIKLEQLLKPSFVMNPKNMFSFKPPIWSSEQEVRFVRIDGSGVVKIPISCIEEVIIGRRTSSQFRRKLRKWLSSVDDVWEDDSGTDYANIKLFMASTDTSGAVHVEKHRKLFSLTDRLCRKPKYSSLEEDVLF